MRSVSRKEYEWFSQLCSETGKGRVGFDISPGVLCRYPWLLAVGCVMAVGFDNRSTGSFEFEMMAADRWGAVDEIDK